MSLVVVLGGFELHVSILPACVQHMPVFTQSANQNSMTCFVSYVSDLTCVILCGAFHVTIKQLSSLGTHLFFSHRISGMVMEESLVDQMLAFKCLRFVLTMQHRHGLQLRPRPQPHW